MTTVDVFEYLKKEKVPNTALRAVFGTFFTNFVYYIDYSPKRYNIYVFITNIVAPFLFTHYF